MAVALARRKARLGPIRADGYETLLTYTAILLLAAVVTALFRGRLHWPQVPAVIWLHLATMLASAIVSFKARASNGGFEVIHFLSLFTLTQAPIIWWWARTHDLARHRGSGRGMVTGALLIAGVFTFPLGCSALGCSRDLALAVLQRPIVA